jgi:hypothetical protein
LKNPSQKEKKKKKDWWSGSRCRPWVQTPVKIKKKKMESGSLHIIKSLYSASAHAGDEPQGFTHARQALYH